MYSFGYDAAAHALVGLKSGPPDTDADYERVLDSLAQLVTDAKDELAVWVFIIDSKHPPPGPGWRRRFADGRTRARELRFVMVTESAIERGIITALNWVKPPSAGQRFVCRATFEIAVSWLEGEADRPMPILYALRETARAEARLATQVDMAAGSRH